MTMTAELRWDHRVQDIPESGLTLQRQATPEELAAIVRALDLGACDALSAEYALKPTLDGRYRLSGRLRAHVVQACVVTLEPVASTLDEEFDVTFWPEERMPAPEGGALDLDDEPEPEPIVAGHIMVGRVVFECLAAALDPFPRAPDATLDRHEAAPEGAGAGTPASPFAVLAKIRPKA
jgi:hypothetical protein